MSDVVNQSFRHESNLTINYVRIFQGDVGLDITQLIDKLIIQEDIEKGFVYGKLYLLDEIISSADAFVGNEMLHVSFTTANADFEWFEPYEKIFRINSYGSVLQTETGAFRALELSFVSEPSVKNDSIKLARSYNNVSNSAFVNECCDILGVDIPRNIEETLHAKHFIAPNVSPLDMINWVKTTSQSKENNGSDFYFFENKEGINFKCMETLKTMEPEHVLIYKPNVDNSTYNIITKFQKTKGYDIQDDMRYGGIGCTVYTHDLVTKQYSKFTLDPSTIETMNPVSPRSESYENSPSAYVQFWPHNNAYSTMDLNSSNHSALLRSVTKTLTNFKSISVEIAGNVDIKSGDVVEVIVPGVDGEVRVDESGKWIVKKLRHILTRMSVITQLELISDSNIERIEETSEPENIEEK